MKVTFYTKILILSFLTGCSYIKPKEQKQEVIKEVIIARAGDEKLDLKTLKKFLPKNFSKTDSTSLADKLVRNWIKKQLLLNKAQESSTEINEAKIEQKVLDYKYALIVHDYEQRYIEKKLNKEVSQTELENYFKQKSDNFILRENLVKCLYFKLPKKAPNTYKFKRLLKKYPKDSIKLNDYANEFAQKAFTESTTWVKFSEVIGETPLKETNDKSQLLKLNSFIESKDDNFEYYIKILEKKMIGDVAPLSFVSDNVKAIIINHRKIKLKKELEKSVYEEAKATDEFEIYKN